MNLKKDVIYTFLKAEIITIDAKLKELTHTPY